MNKYSSYKDSELFWFKSVPKHWVKTKNKFVLVEKDERVNENSNDYKLLSLTKKGIILRDIESGKGKFPESFDTYKIVTKGDVIFCLYDIEETPRTVGFSELNGMISGSYKIFGFTEKMIGKYFYYYFLHVDDEKGLKPYYTGLRNVVRPETFKSLDFFSPPLSEQQQIVTFLDDKTQKIDSLIQQKKEKIELLKEKRTSLINHVVTKGLDSNVEMKDSGVEWIGEIPNHWKTGKLKNNSDLRISSVDKHILEEERKVTVCNYTDVYYNEFITSNLPLRKGSCSENEYTNFLLKKGDVIITKDSESPTDIGVPSLVKDDLENVVCGYHLSIMKSHKTKLVGDYLFRQLQTKRIRSYFEINSNGITRFGLGKSSVLETLLILPPVSEQQQIVEHLDKQTEEIDTLIKLEQKKIDTLKEYRQSLISEVVTGKVRVCKEDNSLSLNSQIV